MSVSADAVPPAMARAGTAARRNVVVLLLAQAFIGVQLPLVTVLGGLAGQALAGDPRWATLPIAVQGIGAMTSSLWLSRVMQSSGRRAGFLIGVVAGGTGAAICGYGLMLGSFPVFVLGAWFTGVYQAAQGFYRFAAMDAVEEARKPRAMSLVLAAGLVAAVAGTQLTKMTSDLWVVPFLGSYVAAILINVAGCVLFAFLDIPGQREEQGGRPVERSHAQLIRDPDIRNAILCAATAYGVMLLIMGSTPLAVVGFGCSHGDAADIIMVHVLSMFAPSFVTGTLIARYGAARICAVGLSLLAAAGVINLLGTEMMNFYAALAVLGLGWNFLFLGSTALLSTGHTPGEKGRVQGLNEMVVSGTMAVASLGSGLLMNAFGSTVGEGWAATNLAVFPMIALAGASLFSIARQRSCAAGQRCVAT